MKLFTTNFLTFYIYTMIKCFFSMNLYDGGGGAPPEDPKDKPKEIKKLTMENLKGIIQDVVKTEGVAVAEEIKQEIITSNRKSIFPNGDWGGEVESIDGKSIVDTSYFNKSYGGPTDSMVKSYGAIHPALPAGVALGSQLQIAQGPFKRLSPEMENFAKLMKCRGKLDAAAAEGMDIQKNNDMVRDHLKQAGMNEGVVSQGGALVPVEYLATVIEFATAQSQILSQVWRIPMNTQTIRMPRLVQAAGNYFGGITLYSPDEGELKTSSKPVLERLTLTAKKLIGLIYLTDELIADSAINVVNFVTGLFVRAFQYDMEHRVIAGTGVGPCTGIINDPGINSVARQAAGTISFMDIKNLDDSLDENFMDLSFIMRKVTQNTVMTLRDTNNRPIFYSNFETMAAQNAHPPSLWGYPVYRTRNVPAMGTSGDVILGDLKWYMLGMRQDMTIDSSQHVRFVYDEQCIRFVMRFDGQPAISIAFSKLDDVSS